MIDYAADKNFCISRFLITNLESTEAVTKAAEVTDSPALYDIYLPLMENTCLSCVEDIAKKFINDSDFPSGLFADHVESVEECLKAIDRGYSGVMIDLSKLSFEENIKGSKEVVDYAHKKGVFVEGEVGTITRSADEIGIQTDPGEAVEYVRKTGVDCLGVSVGVQSGFYEREPDINFSLIKKLNKIGVHLTLHGASGLSKESIRKCIQHGMHSTGIGTDPLYKYFKKIDDIRNKKGDKFVDPSQIILPARDAMQKEIEDKIYYFKSNNRAREIINLYKNEFGKYSSNNNTNNVSAEKIVGA